MTPSPLILVTGSTGYVATRLIPALLQKGYRVRALARRPERLQMRPWCGQVEIVQGDVLKPETLVPALEGVTAAYYLIHNMSSGTGYRENEVTAARNFGELAKAAGVAHIIYLGGLGGSEEFRHMRSRQETGNALRASGVPVTELRASVIIGTGSISFEMIRTITEWFPLVPAPMQTNVSGQPIGTKDLLAYLIGSLEREEVRGKIFEIGGKDQLRYPELMLVYARMKGLKRWKFPLPFFNPALSARVADWLTPVPLEIAKPLMEELVAPSIVTDTSNLELFADISLSSYVECVDFALKREEYVENEPWTSSLVLRDALIFSRVRTLGEGLLVEYRQREVSFLPGVVSRLFDGKQAMGWVTEAHQPGEWVRLKSGQRLPGALRVEIQYKNGFLSQTAMFEPNGLVGRLWWYLLMPGNTRRLGAMFKQLCSGGE